MRQYINIKLYMTIICLYNMLSYVFHVFFWIKLKISQFWGGQTFWIWWKRTIKSRILRFNNKLGLFGLLINILVPNSQAISFWILQAVLLWKTISSDVWLHVQSDKVLILDKVKVNISECNNQVELIKMLLVHGSSIPIWNSFKWRYLWNQGSFTPVLLFHGFLISYKI